MLKSLTSAVKTLALDSLGLHVVRKGLTGPLLERDLLERFFRSFDVDCVFDVGANIGQYAMLLRSVHYDGPIVSFEPNPKVAKRLREAAARDPKWFVEEVALDESERDLAFHVMAADQFSSLKTPSHAETHLFDTMNVVTEVVPVRTARLESFFESYRRRLRFERPFLKMDTQGNDLAVARGAGGCLTDFVGLQSELAVKKIYEAQGGYREALDYYQSRGFAITSFVPNNGGHFPDLIEIDCIMYNTSLETRKPARDFEQPSS